MSLLRLILAAALLARSSVAAVADCGVACSDYGTTLYNCKAMQDAAVLTIGAAFTSPPQALNCMCKDFGSIPACDTCVYRQGYNLGSGNGAFTSSDLLPAWMATCSTWNAKGATRASTCWLGLPNDSSA